MLFQTLEFFIFFCVVATFSFVYRGSVRKWMLLAASYNFYMAWNPRFGALLATTTLIDYFCALRMEANEARRSRKLWLALSLVSNLGLLGAFKYLGFLNEMVNDFLRFFRIESHVELWHLTLPVGISFFTFQSMSYTIDVYRRELPAQRSLRDFALYVAFFPQLVAGPIVRATCFLPQLRTDPVFDPKALVDGIERVLIGLVKKVVVADNLAALADAVFSAPGAVDTPVAWLGTVCFGLQVYLDFSGYSDMAIGLAGILGYRIPENFRLPYLSTDPAEFWHRWHISLSSWLRDYVYPALGGYRRSRARRLISLVLTMLLGGLWHGAHFHFVLWGLGHGLLLAIQRLLSPWTQRLRRLPGQRVLGWFVLTVVVFALWVPFRAASTHDALILLNKMFVSWTVSFDTTSLTNINLPFIYSLLAAVVVVHLVALLAAAWAERLRGVLAVRAVLWGALAFALLQFRHDGLVPFVYFQF